MRPRYSFLNFYTVFGENLPNIRLVPPLGNPGSAPGVGFPVLRATTTMAEIKIREKILPGCRILIENYPD